MTELEVKDSTFYVLSINQDKSKKITLHNDLDSPILRIKECLKNGISPSDVELLNVEMTKDNFKITGIAWSEIAVRLIKET